MIGNGWTGSPFVEALAAPILLLVRPAQYACIERFAVLLNFEGVATTVIAVLVFGRSASRYTIWAIACVTVASILLSWDERDSGFPCSARWALSRHVFLGMDNNFMQYSAKDPLMNKGWAGTFSPLDPSR